MGSLLGSCVTDFFTYETTKSVVVKSWSVGIINRIVQLLIITYFVGWVFIHEKAYQTTDTGIESSVMTKVKGFGYHHSQVMDVADYVFPSQGAMVFCIVTKLLITENQFQGRCAETSSRFSCDTDEDCQKHFGSILANGAITGVCLKPTDNLNDTKGLEPTDDPNDTKGLEATADPNDTKGLEATADLNDTKGLEATADLNDTKGQCEIEGWCPAENDNLEIKPMLDVDNFTIFIKNSIRFPLFDVTRGNFPSTMTTEQIKSCNYHPEKNPFCPIFRVGDVLNYTGQNIADLADKGAEIGINIGWKCNLDLNIELCVPKYSFTRLDAPFAKNAVSKGYNFRFAKYFKTENGSEYRRLHKAFAIRFDVMVTGNAGKFDTVPTLINLVAAFTSIGLGTVLCDIILLNFLKGAEQYKAKKFEEVSEAQIEASLAQSPSSQLSLKSGIKNSYDSGAISLAPSDQPV